MGITVRYESREGYLRAEVAGVFTLAAACRVFREALAVVEARGASRVLIDCLALTGRPSTSDLYSYGEFIAAEIVRHAAAGKGRLKLAYVVREPLHDPNQLTQTVARNRAAPVAFVETVEEALRWLGVGPNREPGERARTTRAAPGPRGDAAHRWPPERGPAAGAGGPRR